MWDSKNVNIVTMAIVSENMFIAVYDYIVHSENRGEFDRVIVDLALNCMFVSA